MSSKADAGRVADEGRASRRIEVGDVVGGVARGVENPKGVVAKRQEFATREDT